VPDRLLTDEERAVVDCLADAWNAFVELKPVHPSDNREFEHAIHAAQNIILARPVMKNAVNEFGEIPHD